jgi:hypothetical protein
MQNIAVLSAKYRLPAKYIESLHCYEYLGRETGGFLRAVLENDFMAAIGHADEDSMKILKPLAEYIHNELSAVCWGSKERIDEWLKIFRLDALRITDEVRIIHEMEIRPEDAGEKYACDICMKPIEDQTFVKIRRIYLPNLSVHKACAPSGAIKQEEKM